MDKSFVLALTAILGLLSLLVGVRLAAGGAPRRRIGGVLLELWLVFGLWVGVLAWVTGSLGEPQGVDFRGELADLRERLAMLGRAEKWWMSAALGVTAAACVHLIFGLRRAMRLHPLQPTGGER